MVAMVVTVVAVVITIIIIYNIQLYIIIIILPDTPRYFRKKEKDNRNDTQVIQIIVFRYRL